MLVGVLLLIAVFFGLIVYKRNQMPVRTLELRRLENRMARRGRSGKTERLSPAPAKPSRAE